MLGYDVTIWWTNDDIDDRGRTSVRRPLAWWSAVDINPIRWFHASGHGALLEESGYPFRFAFDGSVIVPLLTEQRLTELDSRLYTSAERPEWAFASRYRVTLDHPEIECFEAGRPVYLDAWDQS